MANLPTDMELELAESHRNASRTPSPQLTPCEQLKYNKAQLAKMETFRRCKQACVDALMMMPDHHPDESFYVRALTELHDIEETMALAFIPDWSQFVFMERKRLTKKIAELRIFIEKHSPDIFLIQETHLRPSHNFNIANYTCHRNDRISDGPRVEL
ncbi:hypothetical protein TNCV_276141 [Trichonephila clavipes]|nr:hypothetical protein TNCV_276141 [Trichonephila clavipes]